MTRTEKTYRSIADELARRVSSGQLRPGDKLPPQRDLAYELGVAVATVSRAYAELQRRGLTVGEHGRGTFVATKSAPQGPQPIIDRVREKIVDLRLSEPAIDAVHKEALESSMKRVLQDALADGLLRYQPSLGRTVDRETARAWLRTRGIEAAVDGVAICNGTQHAVFVALASLVRPGDCIVAEQLSHPSLQYLARLMKLKVLPARLDHDGLDPDSLAHIAAEHDVHALYLVPNLQNPTGTTMSLERRRAIAAVCAERNITIVENDVYGALIPEAPPSFVTLDLCRTIYLTGFTKTHTTGLRTAYVLVPEELRESALAAIFATNTMADPIMSAVAADWVRSGVALELLDWQRAEISARRRIAAEVLGAGVVPEGFANHLWLALPESLHADGVIALAQARGILLGAPNSFAVGRTARPNAVRIGLGAAGDRADLRSALEEVRDVLAMLTDVPRNYALAGII